MADQIPAAFTASETSAAKAPDDDHCSFPLDHCMEKLQVYILLQHMFALLRFNSWTAGCFWDTAAALLSIYWPCLQTQTVGGSIASPLLLRRLLPTTDVHNGEIGNALSAVPQ